MDISNWTQYVEQATENVKKDISKSEKMFGEKWWQKYETDGKLDIWGTYDKRHSIISDNERSDSPILENHTYVKSSYWKILQNMLINYVLDFFIEHKDKLSNDIFAIDVTINMKKEKYRIEIHSKDGLIITDDIFIKFNHYEDEYAHDFVKNMIDIIVYFYEKYNYDIPKELETMEFGFDRILTSVETGKWNPEECDSYIIISHNGKKYVYSV